VGRQFPALPGAPRIDRHDDELAAERLRRPPDETGVEARGRPDRHPVGAGEEEEAHRPDIAHAAPDAERDRQPPRHPFDEIEERPAPVERGRHVEEADLVRAFAVVRLRPFHEVSGVPQVTEPHSLHYPAFPDVEARDERENTEEVIRTIF
jgi:hypothetical protein